MLTCLSTSTQAEPLATILDYQPSCIDKSLSPLTIEVVAADYVDLGAPEESQAFKQALEALQVQATQQGADAVALTSVKNHVMRATKQLTVNYTSSTSSHKKSTTRLTTHLEAELFKLCSHDNSLTNQRTKFNAQGYLIQSFSYAYTMALPIDESPASLAKNIQVPSAEVSLNTGVYGLNLGANSEQVSDRLGPPSIEITLEDDMSVWGYGRSHWFIFSDHQLIEVRSLSPYMSAYGRNLIEPRDGFDDISWKVNGTIPQKTSIDKVINQLKQANKPVGTNFISISNQDTQLKLSFDLFHPSSMEEPVSLLTQYQLKPQLKSNVSHKIYTPNTPTKSQLNQLESLLNLNQSRQPSLEELQHVYPAMSRLNISGSGVWWLLSNHLQVQFQDDKLTKLRVSPAVFAQEDSLASYLSSIKGLGLPTDKQSLLKQYNDASDNFDMVDLYRDDFALIAKYESDELSAEIYELEVEYF